MPVLQATMSSKYYKRCLIVEIILAEACKEIQADECTKWYGGHVQTKGCGVGAFPLMQEQLRLQLFWQPFVFVSHQIASLD